MNMWFTVQELTACHSFPNTERGGRKFLDKIVKDKPDIKRKRQGTKAFEYAFSGLPEQIQNELCHRYSSRRSPSGGIKNFNGKTT